MEFPALSEALARFPAAVPPNVARNRRRKPGFWTAAASVLLLAGWVLAASGPIDRWRADDTTVAGEQRRIALAAGSTVILNTASALALDFNFWQAFKETNDLQPCHTCPALLFLEGQYPIFMTANQGLRRHIINEFADCMLMPRLVNEVDGALDDGVGWGAFENAAAEVLNDASCSWSDATRRYVESMRLCFPEMLTILHREYRFPDTETQLRFDAMQAFYESVSSVVRILTPC